MKRVAFFRGVILTVLCVLLLPSRGFCEYDRWRKVDEGLFRADFGSGSGSGLADSGIVIVKIDPRLYAFRLLSASEQGKTRLTVTEWCKKHNLISGINAGMYQEDRLTNVGYMKNFSHINNSRLSRTYKAVLSFNRSDPSVPEVQIIDLVCQDFEHLKNRYQSFIQNIRMISCHQENVWTKQDKAWSIAAFGMDKAGNGLFIFSEAPYSGHDFINILLSLPISIHNAMYLEGGPEASLYFSAGGVTFEKIGMHKTAVEEDKTRASARPVPSIIGITKKVK